MESVYAVIDTNVIVSGLLSSKGSPARIVELLRSGELRSIVDDRITGEYAEVLARPEFGFPGNEVDILLRQILSFSVHAPIGIKSIVVDMPDPSDIPFAECAIAFGCPIVTGNRKHYKHEKLKGISILNPSEFIEYLESHC